MKGQTEMYYFFYPTKDIILCLHNHVGRRTTHVEFLEECDGPFLIQTIFRTHLCEHWFAVVRHHSCMVTIQCDRSIVE